MDDTSKALIITVVESCLLLIEGEENRGKYAGLVSEVFLVRRGETHPLAWALKLVLEELMELAGG